VALWYLALLQRSNDLSGDEQENPSMLPGKRSKKKNRSIIFAWENKILTDRMVGKNYVISNEILMRKNTLSFWADI
jgi:hypothetical protein